MLLSMHPSMHRIVRRILPTVGLLLAGTAATLQAQYVAYGLMANAQGAQQLVRLNPNSPNAVTTLGPTGFTLTGIDFRPATNQLYGYDGDKLYTIDLSTGAATVAFDVNNTSGRSEIDFNPTVDRIRVVDASGSNLRLNPITGATLVDMPFTFAMGDVNFGRTPVFTAVAYTNSDNDPATGTTLYAIDPTLGQLVLVTNPNGGAVSTVGSLGIGAGRTITGFDIVTLGGVNTAFFTALTEGGLSELFTVNLGSGMATLVGSVGRSAAIQGLALTAVPEPGTWALMVTGLLGLGVVSRRRRRTLAVMA
jgi:hypothetical protein